MQANEKLEAATLVICTTTAKDTSSVIDEGSVSIIIIDFLTMPARIKG
jgi:hypothetical protein